MASPEGFKLRLDPEDEYTHTPEAAKNYNESMYFNVFDPDQKVGGWFRIGNRPNEGYAEMSNCIYLPDGQVAFIFKRANIANNDAMDAGGMRFDVIEPFKHLRVSFDGEALLMANPHDMATPKAAFKTNPMVPVKMSIDFKGLSPMHGGETVNLDGSPLELDAEKSFGRAHYEQHMTATGFIAVGDQRWDIKGFGVRDKSWGPRFWQAIYWYRWLPMSFNNEFGLQTTITGTPEGEIKGGGTVFEDGVYTDIIESNITANYDENGYQTDLVVNCRTENKEYEITGKVLSLIPLRNRRSSPDGEEFMTRITEGMTEYRCNGHVGYGLSEFLDQVVDGKPVGM